LWAWVFDYFCRVGIQLPTIEVRYENLTVDAKCFVGSRALPTLKNVTINILEELIICRDDFILIAIIFVLGVLKLRFERQQTLALAHNETLKSLESC